MIKIKEYVRAESLEQAYELNQKKSNRIIGGMLWLKMSHMSIDKAIDLSGLGLDTIEETPDSFSIGCMVSLRQFETHEGLNRYTKNAVKESVGSIVGVQMRNLATIGGSVYSRFGFSDVCPILETLGASVELFKGGIMPLEQYMKQKHDRDILVRIHIKKYEDMNCVCLSGRNSATDFPVLVCDMSSYGESANAFFSATPYTGVCVPFDKSILQNASDEALEQEARRIAKNVPVYSNMRASARYRAELAYVLAKRGLERLAKSEGGQNDEN